MVSKCQCLHLDCNVTLWELFQVIPPPGLTGVHVDECQCECVLYECGGFICKHIASLLNILNVTPH